MMLSLKSSSRIAFPIFLIRQLLLDFCNNIVGQAVHQPGSNRLVVSVSETGVNLAGTPDELGTIAQNPHVEEPFFDRVLVGHCRRHLALFGNRHRTLIDQPAGAGTELRCQHCILVLQPAVRLVEQSAPYVLSFDSHLLQFATKVAARKAALEKLHRLSEFQLHSIEQPIRAGQWNEMARLCAATPFPIALDEELIGINRRDRKIELLETIRPQYIILKPSLHGGISGSEEWMELAAERGIGSWVTSALESNIGLNAIAQWCATLQPALPQGLGTGLLFTDNIDYPLHIEGDCLWFDPEEQEPDLLNWLKDLQN